ncbi:hypothetical protein SprV_0802476500 [Sparganum proliferum]
MVPRRGDAVCSSRRCELRHLAALAERVITRRQINVSIDRLGVRHLRLQQFSPRLVACSRQYPRVGEVELMVFLQRVWEPLRCPPSYPDAAEDSTCEFTGSGHFDLFPPAFTAPVWKPSNEHRMNYLGKHDRSIPVGQFASFMQQEKAEGYKKLQKQFAHLDKQAEAERLKSDRTCLAGCLLQNAERNKYKNMAPYDASRVILGRPWSQYNLRLAADSDMHSVAGNYINASYIGTCSAAANGRTVRVESLAKPEFIVTQDPLVNTIGDFWQMIYEQQTPLIVMLSGSSTNGNNNGIECWPKGINGIQVFSSQQMNMCVQLLSERMGTSWLEMNFSVWPVGKENLPLMVRRLQFSDWPQGGEPNEMQLVNFIEECYNPKSPVSKDAGPRVVHCRGGVGRAGVFLAATILKQNLDMGAKNVDIYGCVKQMRKYRRKLVHTSEEYIYLHKFVLAYLNKEMQQCRYDFVIP